MAKSNVKLKSISSKNTTKCKKSAKSKSKPIKSKPSPPEPKKTKTDPIVKSKQNAKPDPKNKSSLKLKPSIKTKLSPRSKTSFKTWLFRRSTLKVREEDEYRTDTEFDRNTDRKLTETPATTDVTGTTETSDYPTATEPTTPATSGSFVEGDEGGTPLSSMGSTGHPPCMPCDPVNEAGFGFEARRYFPKLGRFKACEKFLKRVAYNLGNSASQTEVKIISCIPIDVTDFQKRIRQLEKQLFELVIDQAGTNKSENENKNDGGYKECECGNGDRGNAGVKSEVHHKDETKEFHHRDESKEFHHKDETKEVHHRDETKEFHHRDDSKEIHHKDESKEVHHKDENKEVHHKDENKEVHHKDDSEEVHHKDDRKEVQPKSSHKEVQTKSEAKEDHPKGDGKPVGSDKLGVDSKLKVDHKRSTHSCHCSKKPSRPPTDKGMSLKTGTPGNKTLPSRPPSDKGMPLKPDTHGNKTLPSRPPTDKGMSLKTGTPGHKTVPSRPPTDKGMSLKTGTPSHKTPPSRPPTDKGMSLKAGIPGNKTVPSRSPTDKGMSLKAGTPGNKTPITVSLKKHGDPTFKSENQVEKPLEVNFLHINKCAENTAQYLSDMSFVEPAHKWQRIKEKIEDIDYSAFWPFVIEAWCDDERTPSVEIYNQDEDKKAPSVGNYNQDENKKVPSVRIYNQDEDKKVPSVRIDNQDENKKVPSVRIYNQDEDKKFTSVGIYNQDEDKKGSSVGINKHKEDKRAPSGHMSKERRSSRKTVDKKNKESIKKKPKCTPVYYAQTNCQRFNDNYHTPLSRAYLCNMINKQYNSNILEGDASQISDFSSPICKDTTEDSENCAYISEICSHCYETFHNTQDPPMAYDSSCEEAFHDIDNKPGASDSSQVHKAAQNSKIDNISTEGSFYDSTLYDVVPVKEKPIKARKTLDDMANNKVPPATVEMMCWPESARTKFASLYYDYRTSSTRADKVTKRSSRLKRKDRITKNCSKLKNNMIRKIEMSKSSCIDFGEVYPKLVKKKENTARKCLVSTQVPSTVDAECLTTSTNNCECQTLPQTIATNKLCSNDKSQLTIKQIKAILQSVLREVKINTSLKDGSCDKPRKEVQNGVSRGTVLEPLHINAIDNVEGSKIINSITYSPRDTHTYIPSCSKQNNSCQYSYPQTSFKKYHNFPILIHNSGRPTCPNCVGRHIKCHCGQQAKASATNTDSIKIKHSQVTDKLIKEIYQTMALTMGAVKKDNSNKYEPIQDMSNYVDKQPQSVKEQKPAKLMRSVSELFITKDIQTPSDYSKFRSYYDNTLDFQSTATENISLLTQSSNAPTDTDVNMKFRSIRIQKFLNDAKSERSEETAQAKRQIFGENPSGTLSNYSFTPQPSQVKVKKGILSKMFKSVKLLKSKVIRHRGTESAKQDHLSESEDYQTICSQGTDSIQKQKRRGHNLTKRRTHSKISYKGKGREKVSRKTPYMEQEYRRHWDEKLMFHDSRTPRPRHTPCAAYSQVMDEGAPQRGRRYCPNYETRAEFVDPKHKHQISQTHKKNYCQRN